MQFTYEAYKNMLLQLKESQYYFSSYHNWERFPKCVIMRHDIDQSMQAALNVAQIEAENGVSATYFVLLGSNFYNPASPGVQADIKKLRNMGHEVGLHFDKSAYVATTLPMPQLIQREARVMEALCGFPITTVSMHRPTSELLDSNLQIPGLINVYDKVFFRDFKYISDSRRQWREPVSDIIRGGQYKRLHILTHAFWYHEQEKSIYQTLYDFITGANKERFESMQKNIKDLCSIISESELP